MNKYSVRVNIGSSWKKFFACGCSHGYLIDQTAREAILKFIEDFKPDTRVHLGDFLDTTALRAGAKGSKDESSSIDHDLKDGLKFLQDIRATMVFCGNHEKRPWSLVGHHNAILDDLGRRLVNDIKYVCRQLNAPLIEYNGVWNFKQFRNFKLGHGYMYGENACRDHAEAHGNIIFAHTHRAGMASGRRDDEAMGLCVGTLTDIPNMDYANCRRSTLGWSQGFVYGYYNDKILQPYLCVRQKNMKQWILP